ncbi:MAG: IS1595 family transposase [bacterium]|nr:IS1595 family transposase [bacterium]
MAEHETLLTIAKLDEQGAREYLEQISWANGRFCPHCGERERTGALNGIKDKNGNIRPGLYKCYNRACRKQFTVTTGTVMHRTHFSIQQWLVAFHMVAACKKGVAALELQRVLGIGSYKCALHMANRIRKATEQEPLASKLAGIVEADETYIGGKSRKSMPGRGSERKTPVMAVIERGGSAVVKPIVRVNAATLKGAILECVDPSAMICTDEWVSYRGIGKEFAGGHHTVCHSSGEYARGEVHSNTAESFFALLKRGVHGTYHHVSKKHMLRYCDEFAFRWNHRKVTDGARASAIMAGIGGKRLTYRQQVAGE